MSCVYTVRLITWVVYIQIYSHKGKNNIEFVTTIVRVIFEWFSTNYEPRWYSQFCYLLHEICSQKILTHHATERIVDIHSNNYNLNPSFILKTHKKTWNVIKESKIEKERTSYTKAVFYLKQHVETKANWIRWVLSVEIRDCIIGLGNRLIKKF